MEYELYHYGVRGMKWGIRRYQNKDGSLTAAGEKREQRKIDRRFYSGMGVNYSKAISDMNDARLSDKTYYKKFKNAYKAGKGTKQWSEWETYRTTYSHNFKDQFVDAWMKDSNTKRLSAEGRMYLEERLKLR